MLDLSHTARQRVVVDAIALKWSLRVWPALSVFT